MRLTFGWVGVTATRPTRHLPAGPLAPASVGGGGGQSPVVLWVGTISHQTGESDNKCSWCSCCSSCDVLSVSLIVDNVLWSEAAAVVGGGGHHGQECGQGGPAGGGD